MIIFEHQKGLIIREQGKQEKKLSKKTGHFYRAFTMSGLSEERDLSEAHLNSYSPRLWEFVQLAE